MSAISLNESAGIRVVELPKSDRKVQPESTEPVELTGKASTEETAHKELKRMFQSTLVQYARRFNTLREAIETCKKAGVTDKEMEAWAVEVGYSLQTFRNVQTNIRKDSGEMLKVVRKDDRRLARNRQTPAERSLEDRVYSYMVRECGSLKAAAKLALKLSRRFTAEDKAKE